MAGAGQDHLYKKVELAGSSVDPLTDSVTTISIDHQLVHEAKVFHMTVKIPAIAIDGTVDFLMRVPAALNPHIHIMRANTGAGDIDIVAYEAATVSAPGTLIPTKCTNRKVDATPLMLMYSAPTVTDVGEEIHRIWVPPTATGQGNSIQGVHGADAGEEWILKADTDYIQRFTNNSGVIIGAWVELLWFELD